MAFLNGKKILFSPNVRVNPVGRQTKDGGEVFNDYENNEAISQFTHVTGSENFAGCKGYYWYDISFNTAGDAITVILSKERRTAPSEAFNTGYQVGDLVSLVISDSYYNFGTIKTINDNVLTITYMGQGFPFTSDTVLNIEHIPTEELPFDYCAFFVLDKPEVGEVDIGICASSFGYKNKSLSPYSFSIGKLNISWGKYSCTVGEENEAEYACFGGGRYNKVFGNSSFIHGIQNTLKGIASFISGGYNILTGNFSNVSGQYNELYGDNSDVSGTYNKLTGKDSHISGRANEVTAEKAIVSGYQNKVISEYPENDGARFTSVFGFQNIITGLRNTIFGRNNTVNSANEVTVFGSYNQIANNCNNSFVSGYNNRVVNQAQTVFGKNNKQIGSAAFIIGNGSNDTNRSNAMVVDWKGNMTVLGDVACNDVILTAPGGYKYKLTVDAGGNLSTVLMQ